MISEKLSIIANNVGAVYQKGRDSAYSEFWDSFQSKGERTDYSYAFANWGVPELTPKYPITADRVIYMFMNCTELTDCSGITVNVNSSNPSMMYVCVNAAKMIKAPVFNFTASIVKTYISTYAGCQSLQEVSVYWGDGTADPVTQRNSCQNMFFKCHSLVTIDFGAEESGSPINLDLSYSKELSTASVQSLLTSLQTIPENSAGKYEIILAQTTYDANSGLIEGFTAKGWTVTAIERNE